MITFHVMHIIDSLEYAGAQMMLVEIANKTINYNIPVSICITRKDDSMLQELDDSIKVYKLNRIKRFDISGIKYFIKILNEVEPHILHIHSRSTLSFISFIKTIYNFKQKIIFHDHFGNIEIISTTPYWFRYWAKKYIDKYICVSEDLEKWAINSGLDKSKIRIISNKIDLKRFNVKKSIDLKKQMKISGDKKIGIFIGRLVYQKGFDLLIDIVSESKEKEKYRILIVGQIVNKKYYLKCLKKINNYGLNDNFIFLGVRNDIPLLLNSVDFALLTSRSESGPLVLIEYMASSVPFLSFEVGNISKRSKKHGIKGFVNPNDIKQFTIELDRLIKMEKIDLNNRINKAKLKTNELFDIDISIPLWLKIYKEIL